VYTTLLFLHFVGLALGVGSGFASLTLSVTNKDLPPAERVAFFLKLRGLSQNGSYGLLLLLATGFGMMFVRGIRETFAWGGPAFHAKLTLVVVLIGVFGYQQVLMKRARDAGGGPLMATIPVVGRVLLALSLGIILTAVLAFH